MSRYLLSFSTSFSNVSTTQELHHTMQLLGSLNDKLKQANLSLHDLGNLETQLIGHICPLLLTHFSGSAATDSSQLHQLMYTLSLLAAFLKLSPASVSSYNGPRIEEVD